MPKFQHTAPRQLAEVIARVRVKTETKELALEYLLYLAKLLPNFPKKDYGTDALKNCTLQMSKEAYSEFSDYRTQSSPILETKKAFFVDALTRGASLYEKGFRLTEPMKARESTLTVDREWNELSVSIASILDDSVGGSGSGADPDEGGANRAIELAIAVATASEAGNGRETLQHAVNGYRAASGDSAKDKHARALVNLLRELSEEDAHSMPSWAERIRT